MARIRYRKAKEDGNKIGETGKWFHENNETHAPTPGHVIIKKKGGTQT